MAEPAQPLERELEPPAAPARERELHGVPGGRDLSAWHQPRTGDGAYAALERRSLPALTSLRFFAAMYVVVHHLINIGLLWSQGDGADRSATWYLAWGTQGHVGVTFFFVLSGFILAWCYHSVIATAGDMRTMARKFWIARFARVWPLHAAMFFVAVPIALLGVSGVGGLVTTAWQGVLNLLLLHAWVPTGGREGLAETFNGPSWTLSCEALFYVAFPLLAALLVRRWRVGIAQLALMACTAWLALGAVGVAVAGSDLGFWFMRVSPIPRFADFVIGVGLGLAVVQLGQRDGLLGRTRAATSSRSWTLIETAALAGMCAAPLLWATAARHVLPATLGSSWFHLPFITLTIGVLALERGAISRRVLAVRPLLWLGEVSYALYLTHLVLLIAAYRLGAYDLLGLWPTSILLVGVALAVAGVVHERFEKPMRRRIVARLSR